MTDDWQRESRDWIRQGRGGNPRELMTSNDDRGSSIAEPRFYQSRFNRSYRKLTRGLDQLHRDIGRMNFRRGSR
jgi:hypothetical protein